MSNLAMNDYQIPEHILHECDGKVFTRRLIAEIQALDGLLVVPVLEDKDDNVKSIPSLISKAGPGIDTQKIMKQVKSKALKEGIIKDKNCQSSMTIEIVRLFNILSWDGERVKDEYAGVIGSLLLSKLDEIDRERFKPAYKYLLKNLKDVRNVTLTILKIIFYQD